MTLCYWCGKETTPLDSARNSGGWKPVRKKYPSRDYDLIETEGTICHLDCWKDMETKLQK